LAYVCSFRGRRDSYQVPLALAEAGMLDAFITDIYRGPLEQALSNVLPLRAREKLLSRFAPGLPNTRVHRLNMNAALASLAGTVGVRPDRIYAMFDPAYGSAAARRAQATSSDLFMYSAYAWSAFSARNPHAPRKILFQFHPHHRLEAEVIKEDAERSAEQDIVFQDPSESAALLATPARRREDDAWMLADAIVCASSFTKRSLVQAGADPQRIRVVPYGVAPANCVPEPQAIAPKSGLQALFVGTGIQRKGLHHLLLAWRRAHLPSGSQLTLITRKMDPGLQSLVSTTPGIVLRPGVSNYELMEAYQRADVFVMPSLVEGFGQVYLEALSFGLPVIGSDNTCLPDLGGEADGILSVAPGDIDGLAATLTRFAQHHRGDMALRARARTTADCFTWERFRTAIQDVALQTKSATCGRG
jgi:glycosyltransferase involved in cell wall biosynthesis